MKPYSSNSKSCKSSLLRFHSHAPHSSRLLIPRAGTGLGDKGQGSPTNRPRFDDIATLLKPDPPADLDYLSELLAIQQSGPKLVGFFGTRNMGLTHQQLIEILSYALVTTGNQIFTSGATGTNAAVIRGALRSPESAERLTVVLPQSRSKQPPESQELLAQVKHVIEMPQNDDMPLVDASRICNRDIIRRVQQVICFAYHDSKLLLETCSESKDMRKIVTLFYLD